MLNQDNWPEFYREATEHFNSLGFDFEPLSSDMAIQVGRTDQLTFILIAKYLETLSSSLPQEDAYAKMVCNLGELGDRFLDNLSKYPEDYQYIFFIAQQTQPREVFRKIMELGITAMMYIDSQAEVARIDLKDESSLLELMNECVIHLAKTATKQIKTDLEEKDIADKFDIGMLIDTLTAQAKKQYKLSRNVILN